MKGEQGAPEDSLELLREQDLVLAEIFRGWDASAPSQEADTRTVVEDGWHRGTFGKLLIEHAAVRAAAKDDIAGVLCSAGHQSLADDLTERLPEVKRRLGRLDELSRGVHAMSLAASEPFAAEVAALAALVRADLQAEPATVVPAVQAALGDSRGELHSARWVQHHAPTHPSPEPRWYEQMPFVVRLHAHYDRLRGFPWAESNPMADPEIAERIDQAP